MYLIKSVFILLVPGLIFTIVGYKKRTSLVLYLGILFMGFGMINTYTEIELLYYNKNNHSYPIVETLFSIKFPGKYKSTVNTIEIHGEEEEYLLYESHGYTNNFSLEYRVKAEQEKNLNINRIESQIIQGYNKTDRKIISKNINSFDGYDTIEIIIEDPYFINIPVIENLVSFFTRFKFSRDVYFINEKHFFMIKIYARDFEGLFNEDSENFIESFKIN